MKYIKTILCTCLFAPIILSPSVIYAQSEEPNHSLQPGARALQFQITDDFTLDSFTGSVISYKRQQTAKKVYRIGVGFAGSYGSQSSELTDDDRNERDLYINLSANFSWMHYVNPRDDVKFYYGYGPEVSGGYDRSERDDSNFDNDVTKTTLVGVGALGYAGVEWFFQQSMSIHAEYEASARFLYRSQKRESSDLGNTIRSFRLAGNGVQFGLSVYF